MSMTDRFFETLAEFPTWLGALDVVDIPLWTLILIMLLAGVGFLFATRELAGWFFKTNSIIDEFARLESRTRDLQGDLAALEETVRTLQSSLVHLNSTDLKRSDEPTETVAVEPEPKLERPASAEQTSSEPTMTFRSQEPAKAPRGFRLDH
jgi:hypothetical protein